MGASPSQFGVDARRRELSLGRLAELLRDIARGGLAGLLTGLFIAGVGGRIVMRLAAILVPDATGRFTENGNRIGEITASGTAGLVLLGGLFFGLAGATVWVVVAPWLPSAPRSRAIVAMPVAVALTGGTLVQARNPDFAILRHDAVTVVLLLLLVALAGLTIALLDGWLDRRLPAANASWRADAVYLALAVAGGGLIFPVVLGGYLADDPALALALVVVGVATVVSWSMRYQGRPGQPPWLIAAGRGGLVLAVVLGVIALAPDVAAALGST